jgi:hypothetical protein
MKSKRCDTHTRTRTRTRARAHIYEELSIFSGTGDAVCTAVVVARCNGREHRSSLGVYNHYLATAVVLRVIA